MGNAQSTLVQKKLSKELPPVKKMGHDDAHGYTDLGMKVFADEDERNQFIEAVIVVSSNNGLRDLADHDFRLLYARRESKEDRIIARIVALKDGVIKAKIEPEADGADQREAFLALKKYVEIQLDRILQAVPSGPGSSSAAGATRMRDEPPAYSSGVVGIGDRKKG